MFKKPSHLLTALAVAGLTVPVSDLEAQTLDLGRGEIPIHVPASYSADAPVPLVVLLHGYGSNGARQTGYMGFAELVDDRKFLLVAPNGTEATTDRNPRYWNGSLACCDFTRSGVDDSGYVRAIIDEMKDRYSVDSERVYLVGHSNGGFMSFRAAWDHPSEIAAIVSLAGAAATNVQAAPSEGVHILQIHGTEDETILYDGGEIGPNRYPGAVETVERWAEHNGCDLVKATEGHQLDLDDAVEGFDTTVSAFERGCVANGSSELWTIEGGSHVPDLSDNFATEVLDWLWRHSKG